MWCDVGSVFSSVAPHIDGARLCDEQQANSGGDDIQHYNPGSFNYRGISNVANSSSAVLGRVAEAFALPLAWHFPCVMWRGLCRRTDVFPGGVMCPRRRGRLPQAVSGPGEAVAWRGSSGGAR